MPRLAGRLVIADPVAQPAVAQTLITTLSGDPSAEVRREAALALAKLPSQRGEALAALESALEDGSLEVRRAALIGLGMRGDRESIDRLLGLMRERPELALDVSAALVASSDHQAVPKLCDLVEEAESAKTRRGAVRAIGGILANTRDPDDLLFVWEDDDHKVHICS